jgi:hypothetical protein
VPLAKPLAPGSKLIVMLHEESNGNAKFDHNDKPLTEGRGPVMQLVTVE